ncbi:MAG: GNAT family N-acetyltransferase [Rubrivivax sp.]|nr:GNAT family N-acetyltransferase [Rubrivivax sp.]
MAGFDETLMSRVEDAGLNASAPPQQRWLDGWLVRYLPGKARRARCINALAAGRLPVADKLAIAAQVYREANLPMIFRLTRFTQPAGLDDELARLGYGLVDHTRVMIRSDLTGLGDRPLPTGTRWAALDGPDFAEAVGQLRGSPAEHRSSHALRLQHSPVPYQGYAIRREGDGAVLACGQLAREADLVGLYDVFTHPSVRGQGLAGMLCERLLSISALQGAKIAYLQVEADNLAAQLVDRRLGFANAYGYHYREHTAA